MGRELDSRINQLEAKLQDYKVLVRDVEYFPRIQAAKKTIRFFENEIKDLKEFDQLMESS